MKTPLRQVLFLTALLMATADPVRAADIIVDTSGTCTLADAITAANTDTATGGCPAGSGHDTIILETDVILGTGEDARPLITSSITIKGQGHTIDGNGEIGYVLKINDKGLCADGDLTLNNATVTGGNHAHPGSVTNGQLNNGGGICNARCGKLTLNNSTVSGNFAAGNGGGIFIGPQGIVTLNNSTISENTAEGNGGGGIYNDNGTLTLNNSTNSGNDAAGNGGGICVVRVYGPPFTTPSVTLNNSIISGNTASEGNEIYGDSSASIYADSFNLFGDSDETDAAAFIGFTSGISDVTATSDGGLLEPPALSAILHPLADNGGPTKTHALVHGSPAIDLDTTCSTGLSTDQRGEPRPLGDGGDAGAFEGSIRPGNRSAFLSIIYSFLLNK